MGGSAERVPDDDDRPSMSPAEFLSALDRMEDSEDAEEAEEAIAESDDRISLADLLLLAD